MDAGRHQRATLASAPIRQPVRHLLHRSGELGSAHPDTCFLGFGYSPSQAHENIDVLVRSLPEGPRPVPLRVCTFVKTAVFDRDEVSVVYTFHSNGEFVATRTGVRLLLNNLTTTHAYFCKVEVSFPRANREQSVDGARKLFELVLPELTRNHWPDFKAVEQQARNETT